MPQVLPTAVNRSRPRPPNTQARWVHHRPDLGGHAVRDGRALRNVRLCAAPDANTASGLRLQKRQVWRMRCDALSLLLFSRQTLYILFEPPPRSSRPARTPAAHAGLPVLECSVF